VFEHGRKQCLQAGHKQCFKHGHKHVHGTERNGTNEELLTLIAYVALRLARRGAARNA
jgi:hypothetical protein